MLTLHRKWFSNQVTILHMSWQLSCHDMCRFLTWFNLHKQQNFHKISVIYIWTLFLISYSWHGCQAISRCSIDPVCFIPYGPCYYRWSSLSWCISPLLCHIQSESSSIQDRPINSLRSSDPIWWYKTGSSLAQVMACRLRGDKPLPEPMLTYCQLDHESKLQWNLNQNTKI